MAAFGKTRTAAGCICRHRSSDLTRYRALALLGRLRSCEAALDTATSDMPVLVKDQFLDLVHTVRDLVGATWLTVNADDPDVAAFAALDSTSTVPPGRLRRDPLPGAMGMLHRHPPAAEWAK
jgi:hypothetical protein